MTDGKQVKDKSNPTGTGKHLNQSGVYEWPIKVAYLSEVQTSGTEGGSTLANSTVVRTLNTKVDPDGIVTSLISNQFTLPAGTYDIYATSPVCASDRARAYLYNVTDSVKTILGTPNYNYAAAYANINSVVSGQIVIAVSKVFELRQYTLNAHATNGLGVAGASGDNEVFSIIKITKYR